MEVANMENVEKNDTETAAESASDKPAQHPAPDVIAVPSAMPGGLEAKLGIHFGRCECFTIVAREGSSWAATVVPNLGANSCVSVISMLKKYGAQAVAARHMGMRPLQACLEAGLTPYIANTSTVWEAVEQLTAGKLEMMGFADSCREGDTHRLRRMRHAHHGEHHHDHHGGHCE